MKNVILFFFMAYSMSSDASTTLSCDKLLTDGGVAALVKTPVLVHPQIPSKGVIDGFFVNELIRDNNEPFHPKRLDESLCVLDAMLEPKTRKALRNGVQDFMNRKLSVSSQANRKLLWASVNLRLDELYVDSGMPKGVGNNLILGLIEKQLDIRLFGGTKNQSILQREAAALGITSPKAVLRWVWFSYLESLRVKGFESEQFIELLKTNKRNR